MRIAAALVSYASWTVACETASGDYPAEAVQTMATIALRTESSLHYKKMYQGTGLEDLKSRTRAVAHATVQMAMELDADAIITPTVSGYTARIISHYRPKSLIVAYTPDAKAVRQLNLRWGVHPIKAAGAWTDEGEMIANATAAAVEKGCVERGDLTIITSGIKSEEGNTNAIRVYTI